MRQWIQATLASVGATLGILTFIVPNWIENIFGVDPDNGNGSLEFIIAIVLLSIATVLAYDPIKRVAQQWG